MALNRTRIAWNTAQNEKEIENAEIGWQKTPKITNRRRRRRCRGMHSIDVHVWLHPVHFALSQSKVLVHSHYAVQTTTDDDAHDD